MAFIAVEGTGETCRRGAVCAVTEAAVAKGLSRGSGMVSRREKIWNTSSAIAWREACVSSSDVSRPFSVWKCPMR